MKTSLGYFWITLLLIIVLLREGNAALHKGTKMLQRRITRQSGHYNNYQAGQIGAYSVRGGAGGSSIGGAPSSAAHATRSNVGGIVVGGGSVAAAAAAAASGQPSIGSGGKFIFKNAPRPVGVGAYTFGGGGASGRPAYGPTFAINSGSTGGRPQFPLGGGPVYVPQNIGRPQQNAIYRGAGGRPGPGLFQG